MLTGKETKLIEIAKLPSYLPDFYGQSLLRSLGNSAFHVRHVSISTKAGYIDLTGNTLTIDENNRRRTDYIDEENIGFTLKKFFNIEI